MTVTTTRRFTLLTLLALPAPLLAQAQATEDSWSLGAGAAVIDSPYAGEGTRVRPFPLVSYDGERVFLRGISGGVHLYESSGFAVDAIVAARLYGFDIDDLGRRALIANGLDPSQLRDRDDGIDAGLRFTYGSRWGAISLEAASDISNTSDGHEISLDYRYTWTHAQTALTANVGANYLSSKLAGYYFGILDEEVARGVAPYRPGSAVMPHVGLSLTQALGTSKWRVIASAEYQFLPDELADSPLLEPDRDGFGRLVLGLTRSF
ncbi:MipA/OmpV family protein [Stenotrophomonas sp. HITSZ_GD]|uniref:MipA/OmpV family protein n=1 Tax=Stenotrophomonas sp. HITSZ_GD TaxID=3037248 RepID=UPI00240E9A64|nr:MipA/OmpV family protein [Stenotrophomonas sp. HITSZ_GD]MDG2524251.1 MipA/OmpV family protein [Stenotrophomonas sp. HITSZ_GD]